jgi:hypothetical protein
MIEQNTQQTGTNPPHLEIVELVTDSVISGQVERSSHECN